MLAYLSLGILVIVIVVLIIYIDSLCKTIDHLERKIAIQEYTELYLGYKIEELEKKISNK